MKVFRLLLVFTFLVALLAIVPAASAGMFTYTSGFQVQNLEADTAHITVYFYRQDGSQPPGTPLSGPAYDISANSSKTFFPLTVETGFNGSVVVASDNQVSATTNVASTNYYAWGCYSASPAGNTSGFLPLLFNSYYGYTSWFNVQNTGGSDAHVYVDYSDGIRAPAVGTYTIPAGAAKTFEQSTEGHAGSLVLAGTITSDVPIAATVMQESSKVILAYSGFTGGYNNPAMPLINSNNSNWTTGIQIYNSGGSSTQVRVDYYPTWTGTAYIGTACHETRTIPSNDSRSFTIYVFGPHPGSYPLPDEEDCIQGERFVGTARVTSNGASMPLSAIVNQTNPTSKAGAYASFNPLVSTTKVVFPLIMDRNGVWLTGFNIMNVGTLNTNVSCVFTPPGALGSIGPILLQPNASLNHIQLNKLGVNYVGSATCTSTGIGADPAQPIIGVVNEVTSPLVSGKDQFMVYEGANISP